VRCTPGGSRERTAGMHLMQDQTCALASRPVPTSRSALFFFGFLPVLLCRCGTRGVDLLDAAVQLRAARRPRASRPADAHLECHPAPGKRREHHANEPRPGAQRQLLAQQTSSNGLVSVIARLLVVGDAESRCRTASAVRQTADHAVGMDARVGEDEADRGPTANSRRSSPATSRASRTSATTPSTRSRATRRSWRSRPSPASTNRAIR
jgi:hypothetical protein